MTIVRLSYDVVRFTYDFTDIIDVSQTHRVQCGHKRLQYRSRIGENFRNLRCHPSHDVAARCDQGLRLQYRSQIGKSLEIYDVTHRTTPQLGVTNPLHFSSHTIRGHCISNYRGKHYHFPNILTYRDIYMLKNKFFIYFILFILFNLHRWRNIR